MSFSVCSEDLRPVDHQEPLQLWQYSILRPFEYCDFSFEIQEKQWPLGATETEPATQWASINAHWMSKIKRIVAKPYWALTMYQDRAAILIWDLEKEAPSDSSLCPPGCQDGHTESNCWSWDANPGWPAPRSMLLGGYTHARVHRVLLSRCTITIYRTKQTRIDKEVKPFCVLAMSGPH